MEWLILAMGGGIGFALGALERWRLQGRIRELLTSLPDSKDVSLSLTSLVRREMTYLQDQCGRYQEAVAYWRGIVAVAPWGYLLIDGENHLEWCNSAAQSLFHIRGWQEGERRLFLEFIRSYELDNLVEHTRQADQSHTQSWAFFPPLGASAPPGLTPPSVYVQVIAYPLTEGRVAVFVENQQQVMELRQGRDQAFSDLAHELRTPLTAMALIGERLQSRLGPDDQSWGDRLLRELQRLQNLVESWLHLTQMTAHPNRYLEPEPLDLAHLLQVTWERLMPIADEKGITLHYDGPRPLTMEGDGDRLMQVLMNVLDNGLKYSPVQGTLWVTATEEPQTVGLTLRDEGPGFQIKDLPYIFERLYRGDSSRTRETPDRERQGSGLGLAIAQEIVQAHGGTLTAANYSPAGGAVFTLALPRIFSPPDTRAGGI